MKIRNKVTNSPNDRFLRKNVANIGEGNSGEEARASKLWRTHQL